MIIKLKPNSWGMNIKKISFCLICIFLLSLMFTGITAVDSESEWASIPVKVNIQVDLEQEDDQDTVYDILNEIEKYDGHTTVFVTGEFASSYPDIVRNVELRGHQIAVHGWQTGEDLTLLSYGEQLNLIEQSFSAVRNAVSKPEGVVDFKPQGYKFNDDTIRALQEFGARSISGFFACEKSFCE